MRRYDFAKRLKEIRLERNLSQQELAVLIGVSQANIARWEQGVQDAKGESIYMLAGKLCVSADYLLGLENEEGNIIVQSEGLSSEEVKLVEQFRALPARYKSAYLEVIKMLRSLERDEMRR